MCVARPASRPSLQVPAPQRAGGRAAARGGRPAEESGVGGAEGELGCSICCEGGKQVEHGVIIASEVTRVRTATLTARPFCCGRLGTAQNNVDIMFRRRTRPPAMRRRCGRSWLLPRSGQSRPRQQRRRRRRRQRQHVKQSSACSSSWLESSGGATRWVGSRCCSAVGVVLSQRKV